MGVGFKDDLVSALEDMAADFEEMRGVAFRANHYALDEWTTMVTVAAITKLDRRHWLLSESITNKVIDYIRDHKVYAMAGFRFRAGRNLGVKHGTTGIYVPDPGYYGQYHEGGKRKFGKPYRTVDHFLRKAKKEKIGYLDDLVEKWFTKEMRDALASEMRRIRHERRQLRKGGNYTEPVDGFPRH